MSEEKRTPIPELIGKKIVSADFVDAGRVSWFDVVIQVEDGTTIRSGGWMSDAAATLIHGDGETITEWSW